MLDTVMNVIGAGFFILGFLLVIACTILIMCKKDDDTARHDQFYR